MTTLFKKLLLSALALAASYCTFAQESVLIPKPTQELYFEGENRLNSRSKVAIDLADEQQQKLLVYLNGKIAPAMGFTFDGVASRGDITLRLDEKSDIKPEGYTLVSNKKGVTIEASTHSGLFYGVQTLLQLMPNDVRSLTKVDGAKLTVPYCKISDTPAFEWRGAMLDVSRHWFDKEQVMRYIDQIAEYKMNIFHWHLTDDQGWRIEIKSRPELTEKGALRAKRVGSWLHPDMHPQKEGEIPTYGGFYTQEDIKEVIEYAKDRYIEIIPEIDVPGHSLVSLVAYPELACLNAPTAVTVGNRFYGSDENSLCAGNPESYKFMEDVLGEVSALFPSEYIHIGGDECFKGFWAKCPKCQKLKKDEGLSSENEIQSHFINEMQKILKSYNKKLIGWDEIHEGGLTPDAIVMSWRGMQGGIQAAKQGHKVIMTPNNHCYLDLFQGESSVEPNTYSMCRLSDSYAFMPVPEGVAKEFVLGGQGSLWTESIPTTRHAEYMTWPRAWALSEVLWSGQDNKDWDNFVERVEYHFERADKAEINYARSLYNAIITPFQDNGEVLIAISTEVEGLDIYYTFDNTIPDEYTDKYSSVLSIPEGATWLKVITYRDGKPIGKDINITTIDLRNRSKGGKRPVGNLGL